MRLAAESTESLGMRYGALLARTYARLDWVRQQKENWRNHGPWDRRAVIWSSCALPVGERRPWLDIVRDSEDILDRAVAQFASTQP